MPYCIEAGIEIISLAGVLSAQKINSIFSRHLPKIILDLYFLVQASLKILLSRKFLFLQQEFSKAYSFEISCLATLNFQSTPLC